MPGIIVGDQSHSAGRVGEAERRDRAHRSCGPTAEHILLCRTDSTGRSRRRAGSRTCSRCAVIRMTTANGWSDEALAAGGPDNITVVVSRLPDSTVADIRQRLPCRDRHARDVTRRTVCSASPPSAGFWEEEIATRVTANSPLSLPRRYSLAAARKRGASAGATSPRSTSRPSFSRTCRSISS